jgi:hypothetical protein
MDIIFVIVLLYVLLILFDLIPSIREKNKKVLLLSIPIYVFTFAIIMMENLGADLSYINGFIVDIVNSMFHITK